MSNIERSTLRNGEHWQVFIAHSLAFKTQLFLNKIFGWLKLASQTENPFNENGGLEKKWKNRRGVEKRKKRSVAVKKNAGCGVGKGKII